MQRQTASSRCASEFETKCLTCGTVIYTSGMLLLWLSLPGMLMGAFSEAVALGVIAAVPILLGGVLGRVTKLLNERKTGLGMTEGRCRKYSSSALLT